MTGQGPSQAAPLLQISHLCLSSALALSGSATPPYLVAQRTKMWTTGLPSMNWWAPSISGTQPISSQM
uniref:Putative secreted protein synganglion overexpressed n=1 Tax=Rhipicephalus microplus TaxID=6941 RepID=A0A6M2DFG9_RHIMP